MPPRKYDTCFFEQYAQIALTALLGGVYGELVNRDRPDLQSPDGHSVGIEVTRAMDENKKSGETLLKNLAGITKSGPDSDELDEILESGYAFGLRGGRFVGSRELEYWQMALPLRRILESKIAQVGNGFYGRFDQMGLFIFSKDDLGEGDAFKAMNYTLQLQKYQDQRYNQLYLADVNDLFACNLDDGLSADTRLVRYRITQEQRQTFYREAVRRQLQAW